jgi:hypothetical protein
MKIRIPDPVVRAWDILGDWSNVPVWTRGDGSDNGGERIEIRRIDIILAVMGIGIVCYYWMTAGAQAALAGGIMYAVVVALALWVF